MKGIQSYIFSLSYFLYIRSWMGVCEDSIGIPSLIRLSILKYEGQHIKFGLISHIVTQLIVKSPFLLIPIFLPSEKSTPSDFQHKFNHQFLKSLKKCLNIIFPLLSFFRLFWTVFPWAEGLLETVKGLCTFYTNPDPTLWYVVVLRTHSQRKSCNCDREKAYNGNAVNITRVLDLERAQNFNRGNLSDNVKKKNTMIGRNKP